MINPESVLKQIQEIRAKPDRWEPFAYAVAQGEDGLEYDQNALSRYALIIALQYCWREEDEALLRFIVEQEIVMHQTAPFQGLDESLRLSTYLLAKCRNPKNALMFSQAKEANFDTYCGLDRECIYSAGIEPTLQYANQLESPQKDTLIGWLQGEDGTVYFDDAAIQTWFEHQSDDYPSHPERENRRTQISRSITFGDINLGRRLTRAWYETCESHKDLNAIFYYAKQLSDYNLAIAIQHKLKENCTSAWDRVFVMQRLAEVYQLSGAIDQAWHELQQMEDELITFESWKQTGLGRSVVELALTLSLTCPEDNPIKSDAFDWTHKLMEQMNNMSLSIFVKAHQAATELNRTKLAIHYRTLKDNEQQRINKMLR